MSKKWLLLLLVMGFVVACAPKTNRVDVDSDDSMDDTETTSKDLETVTQNMARGLIQVPQIANAKTAPRIVFADVTNNTNEILNKNMFLRKIRTLLMKNAAGRMIFVDRDRWAEIQKEREMKRAGTVTASGKKMMSGADFILTGVLDSLDKASGGRRSTYTRYSFRLTDAESGDIYWEDAYEVKKVGKAGLYDR